MRLRVIDFETSGLQEDEGACVVEAAHVDVLLENGEGRVEWPGWEDLVKPTAPITTVARSVHHLTDAELSGGIDWSLAQAMLLSDEEGRAPDVFVAHNAEFERHFFSPQDARWICTYKAALRLWPEAEKHNNQFLRYMLDVDSAWSSEERARAFPPHRALADCWVTAHILLEELKRADVDALARWADEPRYLHKITFGKHRGLTYEEAPNDYLRWILSADFDEDVKVAARRGLGVG